MQPRQNQTLTEHQHFIRIAMVEPTGSVKRLTPEQQKARWDAVNTMAATFRDQLFNDADLRKETQVERRVLPQQYCVELTVHGYAHRLKPFVDKLCMSAEVYGVFIDTSLS